MLLKSLLPGACLSLILFAHAFGEDAAQVRGRERIPSVDLSGIRIEGRGLSADEPLISMSYPTSLTFIHGTPGGVYEDTWQLLTLNGAPIPDSDAARKMLGSDYYGNWKPGTRPSDPYYTFIDRANDLELRFYQGYTGKDWSIALMRVDNRGTWAFLAHRDKKLYGDADRDLIYGSSLFGDWEVHDFLHRIAEVIRRDRFLFRLREYIYIPLYGATWLFPLLWAIEKRKPIWFAPLILWYPLWYIFCAITLVARQ